MTCILKVVLLNFIVVYILLDFCTACEPTSNFCDIEKWSNWSACNTTCGTGVQKREKFMCCQSKPLSTCLSTCNISSNWWQTNAVEFKACGICKNGGVFDATRNRCKCPIGFVGSCCNGEFFNYKSAVNESSLIMIFESVKVFPSFSSFPQFCFSTTLFSRFF